VFNPLGPLGRRRSSEMRAAVAAVAALASASAWAQSELGCNKDTDCKGDRICISGQCVAPQQQEQFQPPPQQQQPPPQQYQQPPPQQYQQPPPQYQQPPPQYQPPPPGYGQPPPPPPQPYYQPRPYRYREPGYFNPILFDFSGMIGFQGIGSSGTSAGGFLLDGYGELGVRFSQGFGLVGLADGNIGVYGNYNGFATEQFMIGGGVRFGRNVALTLGAVAAFANVADTNYFSYTVGGPGVIAHLALPFAGVGFGLHAQASLNFYPDIGTGVSATIVSVGIGFGWSD
jgi:hypothetical protein